MIMYEYWTMGGCIRLLEQSVPPLVGLALEPFFAAVPS